MKTSVSTLSLSILIASCSLLPSNYADPDRYYTITKGDKVLIEFLPPEGNWMNFRKTVDINERNRISFYMTSSLGASYDFYVYLHKKSLTTSPPPAQTLKSFDKLPELLLEERFDEAIAISNAEDDPKLRRHLEKDQGRHNFYGHVVNIQGIKCVETGSNAPVGASLDTATSGKWVGMGAYAKDMTTRCALKKDENTWMLSFYLSMRTADLAAMGYKSDQQEKHSSEEVEADLRQRIQRTFDSLKADGFYQPSIPEKQTAEPAK